MILQQLKPLFGQPCNGCGICCQSVVCQLGVKYLGVDAINAPCPALEFEDGRYWCGLVRNVSKYVPAVSPAIDAPFGSAMKALLSIGRGCDTCDHVMPNFEGNCGCRHCADSSPASVRERGKS